MSEQDRVLLEQAARAAGINLTGYEYRKGRGFHNAATDDYWFPWSDDGDALRLAVKLRMKVTVGNSITMVEAIGIPDVGVEHYEGADVATRRAIVRAAAAMNQDGAALEGMTP